jgi:hypothetical protein
VHGDPLQAGLWRAGFRAVLLLTDPARGGLVIVAGRLEGIRRDGLDIVGVTM